LRLRAFLAVTLSQLIVSACGTGAPPNSASLPVAPPSPAAPAPAPVAPTPAPAPAPTPDGNRAPTISGQDVCISPLDADHVFDLVLNDRDGDDVRWTAEKQQDQGTLAQRGGGPVAAGTRITVVYSPPRGRADENWITVVATDGRGGRTVKRLYVKNG